MVQPEHESSRIIASNLCVSLLTRKIFIVALQRQIWSTFVTLVWCIKTEITDGTGILVFVKVLWDMIFKTYWQFWLSFFKNAFESSYKFNPTGIMPGGGTQLWVGYGCAARSFDHHPITKPEKTQICYLYLNHSFLEGPFLKPISAFCNVNWDA